MRMKRGKKKGISKGPVLPTYTPLLASVGRLGGYEAGTRQLKDLGSCFFGTIHWV